MALVTALLAAGQADMVAQGVKQGRARIEDQPVVAPIDVERRLGRGIFGNLRLRRDCRNGVTHGGHAQGAEQAATIGTRFGVFHSQLP